MLNPSLLYASFNLDADVFFPFHVAVLWVVLVLTVCFRRQNAHCSVGKPLPLTVAVCLQSPVLWSAKATEATSLTNLSGGNRLLWLPVVADCLQVFSNLPAPHVVIRYELYLQEEDLCAHICFCLHPSLSCCTALPFYSLPPSLPRCRLNLFLFIVSSSSSGAGLWVSMLRGSRRSCLCCVVHYNLLYVLKRRKKGPCHVMNKRRKVCGICLLTLDQYFP